jgi:hypothetical protein
MRGNSSENRVSRGVDKAGRESHNRSFSQRHRALAETRIPTLNFAAGSPRTEARTAKAEKMPHCCRKADTH